MTMPLPILLLHLHLAASPLPLDSLRLCSDEARHETFYSLHGYLSPEDEGYWRWLFVRRIEARQRYLCGATKGHSFGYHYFMNDPTARQKAALSP